MTDAELVRQIRLGEDGRLEYKQIFFAGDRVTEPKREKVGDTLAALANGRGGTFVLGVDDKTHEILGIPLSRLETAGRWIREICNDLIKPPLDNADIRKVELRRDDGELVPIIRVDVPRSLFVHGSPGGYYRRLGDSTRPLQAESLARLFQERSQSRVIRFDESVVPWTTPDHLDGDLTHRFLRDDVGATEATLRKLRIVGDDSEGVARLTLAGVLLCTSDPQQWLPHAQIQAVSYAGERHDVNYQSDARDVGGSLDTQIAEALHFVRRKHSDPCDKEHRTGRAPAIQRSSRVRGAGECRGPSGLLNGWRARAPALVCRSAGALRARRTGKYPDYRQPASAASEP